MTSAVRSRLETIQEKVAGRYPRPVALASGHKVELRLMSAGHAALVLEFARALPPDDLLFLRTNITEADVVEEWVQNIARGRTLTILAVAEGHIAGYASLHFDATTWMRHLGEIRMVTSRALRGQGLGRVLASEAYAVATALGLRKLSAQMTLDQAGARATFERLGFRPEALLNDWVMSADGRTRDLLIMAYDLDGLTNTVDA